MAGRDCRYTEIGPGLDPRGMGLAFPRGSVLIHDFSLEILKMTDDGIIYGLERE